MVNWPPVFSLSHSWNSTEKQNKKQERKIKAIKSQGGKMIVTGADQRLQQLFWRWKIEEVGFPGSHKDGHSWNSTEGIFWKSEPICPIDPPKPLRTGKYQVLHKTGKARCWRQRSGVKVYTQSHWNPSSHPSSQLHTVQEETLDLRTPGCAETQGWECRIIGVCVRNCGMPGLAEAIIRVCISSWLGARVTTTAPCLAASVVQRKNWPELPSVSWVSGTKLPPFHF